MYESVIPLQTEADKDNPNTNIFANNQSIYNATTTQEKEKYLKSSFCNFASFSKNFWFCNFESL